MREPRRAGAAILFLALLPPSTSLSGEPPPVPESPERPATVKPPPRAPRKAPAASPEAIREKVATLTLAEVIDIALRNSPTTREAWRRARAAAEEMGGRRAPYYPTLDLEADAARSRFAAVGGRFELIQTSYGPALALEYVLFDSGGRRGDVEEARQALLAADWVHNAAVQDVVLRVEEAYYTYLAGKAQLAAADANVAGAEAHLAAANARHDAGLATIAEVLQARTALSEARLDQLTVAGRLQTLLGALATSLGLPANTSLDVGKLQGAAPAVEIAEAVEPLIEKALVSRPDLAAARSRALEAVAHVRAVRAEGLPELTLEGSASRRYYDPSPAASFSDNWSAALFLRFPVFNGFAREHDLRKAKEEAAAAEAQVEGLENQAVLQVWSSYHDLRTATERLRTSGDLLSSAEESERVALARYKEGVGSVLDLLTAQAALARARAQEIQARSDWFVSTARLAHDVGALWPLPTPSNGAPP